VNSTNAVVNASGGTYVAYCFSSVTGYSSIGSYTGNGSWTGPTVTCGFKPRFVMIKGASFVDGWMMFDSDRSGGSNADDFLTAHSSNAESVNDYNGKIELTATGFHATGNNDAVNKSGGTLIYMAFADTREALLWADKSGKGNDFVANNIDASDEMLDSPTNNFCTMNPLGQRGALSFAQGNLKADGYDVGSFGTMGMNTGKWYWEMLNSTTTYNQISTGIVHESSLGETDDAASSGGYSYEGRGWIADGNKMESGSKTTYASGATFSNGDIIGITFDADNGTLTFYKNNVSQGVAFTSLASGYWLPLWHVWQTATGYFNFGQDSSFAGNKTAQGNADGEGYGDFYYTPPTGYLALCTNNLPEPAVIPSEHFNALTYTGNNTVGHVITGVGFQSDFSWIKNRSAADWHQLTDSVRGYNKQSFSNVSDAEDTSTNKIKSWSSDGFTLGNHGGVNENNHNYISWNWKAGGADVLNENGSVDTQVSAKTKMLGLVL